VLSKYTCPPVASCIGCKLGAKLQAHTVHYEHGHLCDDGGTEASLNEQLEFGCRTTDTVKALTVRQIRSHSWLIRRGSASGWEACREDTACGAADHATDLEKHGRRSLRDKLPAAASCSCVEHDSHAAHLSIPQPFRPSMETCGPLGERWSPPTTSLKSLQTVLYSVWQKMCEEG